VERAGGLAQFNTAVLKDGFLYGLTQQNAFFCINEKTGAVAWTDAASRGTPAGYGSVVDAGPVLLALTTASQLYVVQPTEKAFTQVASIKVAETPTYAYRWYPATAYSSATTIRFRC